MQFHACDNGPRTFSGLNSPNGHASSPSLILNHLYLWLETRRCGAFAGVQNDVKSVGVFARLSICVGLFIRVKKLGLTREGRHEFFSVCCFIDPWLIRYSISMYTQSFVYMQGEYNDPEQINVSRTRWTTVRSAGKERRIQSTLIEIDSFVS